MPVAILRKRSVYTIMARTTTRKVSRSKSPDIRTPLQTRGAWRIKRTAILMFLFSALTFVAALYYVEQQVRLRTLNYDIIELKQHKKQLIEYQKTLQLQLDQLQQLDKIEAEMTRQGFVPVEDTQIRIIQ